MTTADTPEPKEGAIEEIVRTVKELLLRIDEDEPSGILSRNTHRAAGDVRRALSRIGE